MLKACFFHYIFIPHSQHHLVSIDTCDAVTVQKISTDLSGSIFILVSSEKFFLGGEKAGTINKFNHKNETR